jgi:hypothetical protein
MRFVNAAIAFIGLLFLIVNMTDAEQEFGSEQCNSETLALISNSSELGTTLLVSIIDQRTDDITEIYPRYGISCVDVGGQLITTNVSLECRNIRDGVTSEQKYLNYPRCVGTSCNQSDVNMYLENYALPNIANSFLYVTCNATIVMISDAGSMFHFKLKDFFCTVASMMVLSTALVAF